MVKQLSDYPARELQQALNEGNLSLHDAIDKAKGQSNNMTEVGMGLVRKLDAHQHEINYLRDQLEAERGHVQKSNQRYERVAREFLRTNNQRPPPGWMHESDCAIEILAMELRSYVSTFAQGCPKGTIAPLLKNISPLTTTCFDRLRHKTPGSATYINWLRNDNRRAQIAEALVWRILAREVFGY